MLILTIDQVTIQNCSIFNQALAPAMIPPRIIAYLTLAPYPTQEYPSKMRMKPLQTVHPLHGELMMDKKSKVTDPFFKLSCEEHYQPKPTSAENVLVKFKSSKLCQHLVHW